MTHTMTLTVPTKPHFAQRARVQSLDEYAALYRRSTEDPVGFWGDQARSLVWSTTPAQVRTQHPVGEVTWFDGGALNVAVNCVDRHAAVAPDHTAIVWARNEPGEYEFVSYAELQLSVARIANLLLEYGIRPGDRVLIHLPTMPEQVASMLACARIGAVHVLVAAGFGPDALTARLQDSGARVVITANEAPRGGRVVPLKRHVDQALEHDTAVERVVVVQRTAVDVPLVDGRDEWLHEALPRHRACAPAAAMPSEAPLFITYDVDDAGELRGVVHTTAGYLAYAAVTQRYVLDTRPDDIQFCTEEVAWITGTTYGVYGPLCNGITTVLSEGPLAWPDATRALEIIDATGATVWYAAPAALRAMQDMGAPAARTWTQDSLRLVATWGEPLKPELWRFVHDVICDRRCPVIETWHPAESGGVLLAPLPGAIAHKPGSPAVPFFGVQPSLVDVHGERLRERNREGILCLVGSWPGQARTWHRQHARFVDRYFTPVPSAFCTGRACSRDDDGYYWLGAATTPPGPRVCDLGSTRTPATMTTVG